MTDSHEKTMLERMLAGVPYIANDPQLTARHHDAQALLASFNNSHHTEQQKRRVCIKKLFGKVGDPYEVKPPFYCDYGENIYAKEDLFVNYDCIFLDCNRIDIGARVLFGPRVQVYTATHPLEADARRAGWESAHPVTIGDDVWIGGGVTICPGVNIGSRSVIGAGSVVTRDIPAGVLACGNPCRVVRKIEKNQL